MYSSNWTLHCPSIQLIDYKKIVIGGLLSKTREFRILGCLSEQIGDYTSSIYNGKISKCTYSRKKKWYAGWSFEEREFCILLWVIKEGCIQQNSGGSFPFPAKSLTILVSCRVYGKPQEISLNFAYFLYMVIYLTFSVNVPST